MLNYVLRNYSDKYFNMLSLYIYIYVYIYIWWKPSHIIFLIKKRRAADALYLTLRLEVAVQNSIMSFWTVTFSTHGSVRLDILRAVTSKTILKEELSARTT